MYSFLIEKNQEAHHSRWWNSGKVSSVETRVGKWLKTILDTFKLESIFQFDSIYAILKEG